MSGPSHPGGRSPRPSSAEQSTTAPRYKESRVLASSEGSRRPCAAKGNLALPLGDDGTGMLGEGGGWDGRRLATQARFSMPRQRRVRLAEYSGTEPS